MGDDVSAASFDEIMELLGSAPRAHAFGDTRHQSSR